MKKTIVLILSCMLAIQNITVKAEEFVIVNETITMDESVKGFYYWYSPTNGPISWYTPDDYYHGNVYFRYEVVS